MPPPATATSSNQTTCSAVVSWGIRLLVVLLWLVVGITAVRVLTYRSQEAVPNAVGNHSTIATITTTTPAGSVTDAGSHSTTTTSTTSRVRSRSRSPPSDAPDDLVNEQPQEQREQLQQQQQQQEQEQQQMYIQHLANKLLSKPFAFQYEKDGTRSGQDKLKFHQLLHLHHMKTGGTSMDGLLRCAVSRVLDDKHRPEQHDDTEGQPEQHHHPRPVDTMAVSRIHECTLSRYERCKTKGEDDVCLQSVNHSAVVSYCAPLKDLALFGWNLVPPQQEQQQDELHSGSTEGGLDSQGTRHQPPPQQQQQQSQPPQIHALTVLRHPVDRVWSMFRYQTKRCYMCRTLTDVYESLANGTLVLHDEICRAQLFNHQTRNLLSSTSNLMNNSLLGDDTVYVYNDDMVKEAIDNLKNLFTMVGLTAEMNETAIMVGKVFPFLNETVPHSSTVCPMPHANASPENNRCGPDGMSHWDLPSHPDEMTARMILKYNAMDVKLYDAAVELFEYQKLALGMYHQTDENIPADTKDHDNSTHYEDEKNDDDEEDTDSQ